MPPHHFPMFILCSQINKLKFEFDYFVSVFAKLLFSILDWAFNREDSKWKERMKLFSLQGFYILTSDRPSKLVDFKPAYAAVSKG